VVGRELFERADADQLPFFTRGPDGDRRVAQGDRWEHVARVGRRDRPQLGIMKLGEILDVEAVEIVGVECD
jgi:hypothetical protein